MSCAAHPNMVQDKLARLSVGCVVSRFHPLRERVPTTNCSPAEGEEKTRLLLLVIVMGNTRKYK